MLLGVLALYLAMVLFGYSKADPGWSHAVHMERVSNPGGRFGAWLSDLLFYLFGMSAWWWVIFLGFGLAIGFRRLQRAFGADQRSFLVVVLGFLVVLLSSSGLEAMRFYSVKATLPLEPGGVIGLELGNLALQYLGFTGGTLLLLALIAGGLSLFSGVSWIEASEALGAGLEKIWLFATQGVQTWQDRRVGREVAQKREAVVETKRKKEEVAPPPPVRIEPAIVEVEKSVRVEKERQTSLFTELPGGALPPLALLDEPSNDVEPPSAEVLEFTSRLIERKLADFGVEVKVLAAYPGPVITRFHRPHHAKAARPWTAGCDEILPFNDGLRVLWRDATGVYLLTPYAAQQLYPRAESDDAADAPALAVAESF